MRGAFKQLPRQCHNDAHLADEAALSAKEQCVDKFWAMHGLLLASRRDVFKAAVLVAATPRWGDWFLRFWKIDGDRFDYLRALSRFDPIESARSLKATTLWQFSNRDFYIAPMSAVELARAAPRPEGSEPRIEWYEADHAMRSPKARAARRRFLGEQVGL